MLQEEAKQKLCPFAVLGLMNGQCDPVRCMAWVQTGIDDDGHGHGFCLRLKAEEFAYRNRKRIEEDWGE